MASIAVSADIAARTKHFAGRSWVLKKVVEWLDHRSERYLLISGEPGSGKTALAAWLAGAGPTPAEEDARRNLERIRSLWGAAHFCQAEDRRGSLDPARFAQSIALQLANRYDLYFYLALKRMDPTTSIQATVSVHENRGEIIAIQIQNLNVGGNDEAVYNRSVREPLEDLLVARPGEQVYILVDALDEALTLPSPNIVTLLAGSGDLPDGVRFVLTTRDEPKVNDQFGQAHRIDLSHPLYTDDSDRDIRTYIGSRLIDPAFSQHLPADTPGEQIEEELVQQAHGNFLYLTFLLKEVSDGKRSLTDVAGLPRELFGLYRTYLNRLMPDMLQAGTSRDWRQLFQPLLGSLSVAMPAAPRNTLHHWIARDEGEVAAGLIDLTQLTEYEQTDGGAYRLYHRSMADFLAAPAYGENGGEQINRYWTPVHAQHRRVAGYYLTGFAGRWDECDPYGLRHLISHLQAAFAVAASSADAARDANDLIDTVLDPSFREAQFKKLGDGTTTLSDVRTALQIALSRDRWVQALACAGAFRTTTASIAASIFAAVDQGDFRRARERGTFYRRMGHASGDWEIVLCLYLAWEAAQRGDVVMVREAVADAQRALSLSAYPTDELEEQFADGLLVRTAKVLAERANGDRDARFWLRELQPGCDPDALLAASEPIRPASDVERRQLKQELGERMAELALQSTPASDYVARALSSPVQAESLAPSLDSEEMAYATKGLRDLLLRLADDSDGQEQTTWALREVRKNAYPYYRDIALAALGTVVVAVPDPAWVRSHLRTILTVGLEDKGATFTFDLASILTEEAHRRQLYVDGPVEYLANYLDHARRSQDLWGTAKRANSAQAAALFRQGQQDVAFQILRDAGDLPRGWAGYETLHLLALANRWREFLGTEDLAQTQLMDAAQEHAAHVRDPDLRRHRMHLVESFRTWSAGATPSVEAALAELGTLTKHDSRMTYIDHLSARWSWPPESPDWTGLKALLPLALIDATALDAVLGRQIGLIIVQVSDTDVASMVRICAAELATGRPWERLGR